jgi:probable HAF family extracellular repeat protein
VWAEQTGIRALKPLPGDNLSSPRAINDFDDIGGASGHAAHGAGPSAHGVIWSKGTIRDIGSLVRDCNDCSTYVDAITNNQLATGCSVVPPVVNGNTHAYLWSESHGMLDLGTMGFGSSCGVGVNESGAVAGWLNQIGVATIGFFWTSVDGMHKIEPPLGADGWSPATAINNLNEVVGQTAYVGGDFTFFHAYLWTRGKGMTDLGILGNGPDSSQAQSINDKSQVVGFSGSSAFLWTREQGMRDLNTMIDPNSGWVLNSANSITNSGLITGYGTVNAETHAFLLTPKSND